MYFSVLSMYINRFKENLKLKNTNFKEVIQKQSWAYESPIKGSFHVSRRRPILKITLNVRYLFSHQFLLMETHPLTILLVLIFSLFVGFKLPRKL